MALELTTTGLTIQTLQEIREELNAALRGAFGNSVRTSDDSRLGKLAGIWAEREALIQELIEAIYHSTDPDAATGEALVALAAITGTNQEPATHSTCPVVLAGDNGTSITAGSEASVLGTGERFTLDANETLSTATVWSSGGTYAVGDTRRQNGSSDISIPIADRVYRATVGGVAGTIGPNQLDSFGDDIVDGAVHWIYAGTGAAYADGTTTAENTGPVLAETGDLSVIESPITGWLTVRNLVSATIGQAEESDQDLRLRREQEIAREGTSTIDAIRADVLQIDGVSSCTVFENDTDFTDADGMPPHSVECLVQGGVDQDIWNGMLAFVAAGIQTTGTEDGTATDSEGTVHNVSFSRPDEILIYVDITGTYDATLYPVDGDIQVKNAIVAYGAAQKTGKDVVASAVGAQAFRVAGWLDSNPVYIDDAPAPSSSTTIAIAPRELAVFAVSRITVTSTPATP
jgi:uncharacterized phage protein gp47/JayE